MENKSLTKYKYQFNKSFFIIAGVGSVVAVLCIVFNVLRFVKLSSKETVPGFYESVSLILSLILSIAFIVFVVSALINSYYVIDEKAVILRWGVIKNTIKASEVKEIKFITDKNKLELIFEDESYFVISVSPAWQESFINEIKQKYKNVVFIQETTEKPNGN